VSYAYDGRSQLTSANGYESNGTARLSEQWGYVYDTAGNLASRSKNALSETFTPNAQNQITTAAGSGTLTVSGVAGPSAAQVTVNGTAATLYADKTFSLANVSVSATSITAVATDSAGRTVSDRVNLRANVGVSGQYDGNGNLTTDGWRSFTYDPDNQLVSVVVSNSVTDSTKTDFVYDGRMRRRVRTEAAWQTSAWVTNTVVRYVYDGMRVIQERDGSNTVSVTYTRGPDLSGSLEGAGGIGGLLARTHSGNHHFFYHADGNGNISAILNEAGNLVAQYRYDPFGNVTYSKGALADINLYRFSSKEFTTNSGLYYYGFRFYDPNLQRWLNKDPIGEAGGINLYGFLGNDPVNWVDVYGLESYSNAALLAEEGCGIDDQFTDPETGKTLSGTGVLGEMGKELAEQAAANAAGGAAAKGAGSLLGKVACKCKSPFGKAAKAAPKIHPGKQGKHIPGHNNFKPGKSELTHADPQSLIDRFAGKGQRNGQREWVDTGENVGNFIDQDGNSVPTTRITIHYGDDGMVHIVPAPPTPPAP
jgi:RHS repeat-associated protein